MNAWNNSELNCFSDSGMESIRKFGASEISGQQFADGLWEDLLSVGLNVAAGAVSGMEGGPAGMATGAAYGGLRAGVQIGARRLKSEALQRLQKLFESQPKYAYAGAGNSNFKNFANFKKPANNAPRNAKGSGGSGSQGPKMRDFKGEKGKEKLTRENWRFLDKTEQQKIRDGFFEDKVNNESWIETNHTIGGRDAWRNADRKNIYYTKDGRHNDIEVWQVSGKKAKHLGSMEPVEGTMYKGPKHPQQVFE